MRYAKPVIKDKFWIVKDDNVNIATIEKRNTDYVIIKDSVKEQMSSETEVATFFGEDIFANQPKEVKLIKEAHDIEGYPTKVMPYNIEWYDRIPTFTKTPMTQQRGQLPGGAAARWVFPFRWEV